MYNMNVMNNQDAVIIVDQYMRNAQEEEGQKVNPAQEAPILRQMAKVFGPNTECVAIVNDHGTLDQDDQPADEVGDDLL